MESGSDFTPEERARITHAIRAAEARSSGEIVCAVAGASGNYFLPAAAILLGCVLPVSLVAALILDRFWLTLSLPLFALAQLLAAAVLLLFLWMSPRLQRVLTPQSVQARAAHDNALRQFLARNVHRTRGRTGVLLFVSRAERHAEVIADSGIDALVPPGTWDALVDGILLHAHADRLAEGLAEAATQAGALLAKHFPPSPVEENELPDHLVEI
ncbi:MAG: hypothetical protein DI629_12455 [Mesorhizobium amorphae]|nr:MAG: hypothetical protein DI629_12455 [Mesorhizobium amorphae]